MTENELRNQLVAVMESWIGLNEADGSYQKIIDIYNGHQPLARGYHVKDTDAWCAAAVSAAAIVTDCTGILPTECGCGQQITAFQTLGRWQERDGCRPKPGDVIYYDWDDNGRGDCVGWPDHVGIVEKVMGQTITVIEGNKGSAVARREVPIGGRYIRGFGCPDYRNEAAVKSVYELAQLGILNSPDYWVEQVHSKRIAHLEDLLSKAAACIAAAQHSDMVQKNLERLVCARVINSPGYWLNQAEQEPNVGALIKALGSAV